MAKDRKATPVGRVVAGNPMERHAKLDKKTGVHLADKAGQPRYSSWFHLAVRKDDPSWPEFWAWVDSIARAAWPGGEATWPAFAWKYIDGDTGVNERNEPFNTREGYAGHHILKFSTELPIPCVGVAPAFPVLTDPAAMKTGCYVQVFAEVTGNKSTDSPGIYLNPSSVTFVGYGAEIMTSGVDPTTAFGTAPAALPPGASATPLAAPGGPGGPAVHATSAPPAVPGGPAVHATSAPPAVPGGPAVHATSAPPAVPGGPAVHATSAPPAVPGGPAITPHPGILTPPVQAAAPTYVVEGASYSREQLVSFGWSNAQILAIAV